MTTTAVLVMVVSLLVVWGGLGLSIWRLRRDTRQDAEAGAGGDVEAATSRPSAPSPGGAPQP